MNSDLIHVMRPRLATYKQLEPYLKRIDVNHIYSNHGPLVREVEDSYANYFKIDAQLIVAVANATLALQALVANSNVDDWLVPNYTFTASGLAVLNASKKLYLSDVQSSDWKINLDLIPKMYKGFGLLPVMPFGMPIDFESYSEYKHVVIDAAASLGQSLPNFSKMKKEWAVVYSLHATKVLGAGEGALVICGNLEMEEWMVAQEFVANCSIENNWISQINKKATFQPYWIAQFESKSQKEKIITSLSTGRIQSREWWPTPLSNQKAFLSSTKVGVLKNAEHLSSTHLGLPMYRGISNLAIERIINTINSELSKN